GQFAPNLGGQFTPEQVVNLLRKLVVNLSVFSNRYHFTLFTIQTRRIRLWRQIGAH
ncbi:hypothetical protein RCH13_001590, partial [Chryseobacterium sp. MP_3.2]|nr:hypothetical protein [Chryseobacterium sp. MP_3.2]